MFKPVYFSRPLMSPVEIEAELNASGNKDKKGASKEARKLTNLYVHLTNRYGKKSVECAASILAKTKSEYVEGDKLTINFDRRTSIRDIIKVMFDDTSAVSELQFTLDGMEIRRSGIALYINVGKYTLPTDWQETRKDKNGAMYTSALGWTRFAPTEPKCLIFMRNRGNMSLVTMTY